MWEVFQLLCSLSKLNAIPSEQYFPCPLGFHADSTAHCWNGQSIPSPCAYLLLGLCIHHPNHLPLWALDRLVVEAYVLCPPSVRKGCSGWSNKQAPHLNDLEKRKHISHPLYMFTSHQQGPLLCPP
jgi:hypothetical protein